MKPDCESDYWTAARVRAARADNRLAKLVVMSILFVVLVGIVATQTARGGEAVVRFRANNVPNEYLDYFVTLKQPNGSFTEHAGAKVAGTAVAAEAPHAAEITMKNLPPGTYTGRVHARRLKTKEFTPGSEQFTFTIPEPPLNEPSEPAVVTVRP